MNEVEQYISNFDNEIKHRLQQIRQIFFENISNVEESIKYKIPSYKVGNNHLYFAGYKKYIGFYPVYGLKDIESQLHPFRAKGTKDTLHFPHNKTLPIELIKLIIKLKSDN